LLSKIKRFCFAVLTAYALVLAGAYFFQEKFIFQPVRLEAGFRFAFDIPFEERWFELHPGVKINALHFKTPHPKGIIFYLHGNTDNLVRWGKFAADFTRLGYDVLMPDYRTYGKSTGQLHQEEDLHREVAFVYQKILQEYPENQVVVYGRSLGTGLATYLVTQNQPRLLLLETPYLNMVSQGNFFFPLLPYSFLLRFPLRTDLWIRQIRCPVFIFHGTEDEIVPYTSGVKLAEISGKPEILFTIPGGKHKNLNTFPAYHRQLAEWLKQ
jgi:uncharacterized protein